MTDDKGDDYVSCQFCGERDFDLIGLKHHLQNYCEKFENIETLPRRLFVR